MKKAIFGLVMIFICTILFAQQQPVAAYSIGDTGPAGGIIFYDKGVFADGWRYLEAAPESTEFRTEWGADGQNVAGTDMSVGSGRRNTQLIVEHLNSTGESNGAAQICAAMDINGFTDWFLPSKDELNLMHINLGQKGLGGFKTVNDRTIWTHIYWSSSQFSTSIAWHQNFNSGTQDIDNKVNVSSVRAVRVF